MIFDQKRGLTIWAARFPLAALPSGSAGAAGGGAGSARDFQRILVAIMDPLGPRVRAAECGHRLSTNDATWGFIDESDCYRTSTWHAGLRRGSTIGNLTISRRKTRTASGFWHALPVRAAGAGDEALYDDERPRSPCGPGAFWATCNFGQLCAYRRTPIFASASICSPATMATFDDLCLATVAARGGLYLATMAPSILESVGARGVRPIPCSHEGRPTMEKMTRRNFVSGVGAATLAMGGATMQAFEIGRASCRERV